MTTTCDLSLEEIAQGFHALSDTIRIQILEHLQQKELCVAELCDIIHSSQSKLSFHLKVLKEAELVYTRHEGRWIFYSLNMAQFVRLEQYLAEYRRYSQIFPHTDDITHHPQN